MASFGIAIFFSVAAALHGYCFAIFRQRQEIMQGVKRRTDDDSHNNRFAFDECSNEDHFDENSDDTSSSRCVAKQQQPLSIVLVFQCAVNTVCGVVCTSVLVFVCALLLGASPFRDIPHTALGSIGIASLAYGPVFAHIGSLFNNKFYQRFVRVAACDFPTLVSCSQPKFIDFSYDMTNAFGMYGTIICTIIAMILNPLDWGSQIQRWPVPMMLGSTLGYCVGAILVFILDVAQMLLFFNKNAKKE
mmetsp:Transcript_31455/g.31712  ORF Transcript_31455/g.31712 Transcript_31455/m.31712 type:complete len:246 (-) Transcript_31455:123-860(-)